MAGDSLSLKLDKVGTYATIYLNGIKLGEVDNLYRTYYFALKELGVLEKSQHNFPALRKSGNELRIVIDSTFRRTIMDKLASGDSQTMEGPWYTELWPGTSSWVEFSRTQ
jgi:hypothetical protein